MFELPELPFSPDSMGSWTTSETFKFHHGKHHAGYVNKLNTALEGHELAGKSLEGVISSSRGTDAKIFNLSAQHFNHSFFWNCLSASSSTPEGPLAELIDRDFSSLDELTKQFSELAGKHFGSGWVWLVQSVDGKLYIKDFHDGDTPADSGDIPLLTLDVWEHAYYIDHRNDRAGFIQGFWEHVNWGFVAEQLKA